MTNSATYTQLGIPGLGANVSLRPPAPQGAPQRKGGFFAGGTDFGSLLGGFMRGPRGALAGTVLAGIPVAVEAFNQLNTDSTNPAGNMGGAAGAGIGGVAGGLGGAALGGVLTAGNPIGIAVGQGIGAWLGSALGGSAGRQGVNAITGVANDPVGKEIRDNQRRYDALIASQYKALPLAEAQQRLAEQAYLMRARTEAARQAMLLSNQAMFEGAMRIAPGAYSDPSFMAALGAIGSGAS